VTGVIPGCEDLIEVASDGDAIVLQGWQPAFRRNVAVRVFTGRRFADLEAKAHVMAVLADHPNVVTVHDFGVTDRGDPYLVSELLDQGSLADELEREGPLDWYDAVCVTLKVADVLAAARNTGITSPAVTPADLFRSRFGEPKVALFRLVGAAGRDAGDLRPLLRALLTAGGSEPGALDACPASVRATLVDGGLDLLSFARRLQQAQEEAGRLVTELPSDARAETPDRSSLPEDFSGLVTVAPEPRSFEGRHRGPVWGAAAMLLLGLSAGTVFVLDRRPAPTTTTTVSPSTMPTAASERPLAPVLYDSAGFTGPEWPSHQSNTLRTGVVDGEFRVFATGAWTAQVFRPSIHRRLSVSVVGRITPPSDGELSIYCGASLPGDKHLTGTVRTDGSWEISANDRVLATGSAPERRHELGEAFVLRFDCTTDTTPTRAMLSVNDSVLGTGEGTGSFPLNGVRVASAKRGPDPFEFAIRSVTVRPLDE
jgi:hypothetical protein